MGRFLKTEIFPLIFFPGRVKLGPGGDRVETGFVTEKEKTAQASCLRIDPERRLCPRFDSTGIAMFPVAERGKMGFRVVSDFCQEHIM